MMMSMLREMQAFWNN